MQNNISNIIISYRGVSVSSLRVGMASATYYAAVVGDRGWGLVGSAGSCGTAVRFLCSSLPPHPAADGNTFVRPCLYLYLMCRVLLVVFERQLI